MSYVRVKQKYQVTIPTAVRKLIDLHEGDTLEAKVEDGHIILVPQIISNKSCDIHKKKSSLLTMIGANKGSGLYESIKDIDQTVSNQRNEWN